MELAATVARSAEREPRRVGGALLTAAAAAAAGAITASGTAPDPAAAAVARAAIVGVPVAVGLTLMARPRDARFGALLVIAGAGLLVATLAESGDEALHTAGRTAGWAVGGFIVYLVLAAPHGRLPGPVDRVIVAASAATVVALFLPRLLLAEDFLVPSPFASCRDDCPGNALAAVGSEPSFVESVLRPAGALAFVACMVAAVWRLRERRRASTPAARRIYAPVLAVGALTATLLALGFALRDVGAAARPAEAVSWALAFSVPALALAYLAGTWRRQVLAAQELVLESRRAAAEAERELRRSRARLASAAERERRRIERDLHDGAQQRLVALRIELGLAEELVRRDPERCLERLREAEADVDEALEELRALAHGVYPALLAVGGLPEAVRAAAAQSPLAVSVAVRGVGRYRPELEGAVYFSITEALQNALKHAAGARQVEVRLEGGGGELRFSVGDDGAGAPGGRLRPGEGLTNMHDRLAGVGGSVEVSSVPGAGTTVRGRVPLP